MSITVIPYQRQYALPSEPTQVIDYTNVRKQSTPSLIARLMDGDFFVLIFYFAAICFSKVYQLSAAGEESAFPGTLKTFLGIGRSRHVVAKLASLFALDSFAGGFAGQSFAAYWFYLRFGVDPGTLGVIFSWANIFAGISALLARPG